MNSTNFFSEPYASNYLEMSSSFELPIEIHSHILGYLSLSDLNTASLVSKTFYQIISASEEETNYINEESRLRGSLIFAKLEYIKKDSLFNEMSNLVKEAQNNSNNLESQIEKLSKQLKGIKGSYYYRFVPFVEMPIAKIKELEKELETAQSLRSDIEFKLNYTCNSHKELLEDKFETSSKAHQSLINYRKWKRDFQADLVIYDLVGGKKFFDKLPILDTSLEESKIYENYKKGLINLTEPLMTIVKDKKPYALAIINEGNLQIFYKEKETNSLDVVAGNWRSVGDAFVKIRSYAIMNGKINLLQDTYTDLKKTIEKLLKLEMLNTPSANSSTIIEEIT